MNAINIFLKAFSILTNQNIKVFSNTSSLVLLKLLQDSRPKMSQALLNKGRAQTLRTEASHYEGATKKSHHHMMQE